MRPFPERSGLERLRSRYSVGSEYGKWKPYGYMGSRQQPMHLYQPVKPLTRLIEPSRTLIKPSPVVLKPSFQWSAPSLQFKAPIRPVYAHSQPLLQFNSLYSPNSRYTFRPQWKLEPLRFKIAHYNTKFFTDRKINYFEKMLVDGKPLVTLDNIIRNPLSHYKGSLGWFG